MDSLLDIDNGNYNEMYLDSGFIRTLRDHRDYLLEHSDTQRISLEPAESYRWKGDFYGLLNDHGIVPDMRLAVCIVNGLASYSDWSGDTDVLILPSSSSINRILTLYRTTQK